MRSSPGFSTRGLATRASIPAALHAFERRAQTVEIQIVERDGGGANRERGFQLLRSADQEMQSRCSRFRTGDVWNHSRQRGLWIGGTASPGARIGVPAAAPRLGGAGDSAAMRARTASLRHPVRRPPVHTACFPGVRVVRVRSSTSERPILRCRERLRRDGAHTRSCRRPNSVAQRLAHARRHLHTYRLLAQAGKARTALSIAGSWVRHTKSPDANARGVEHAVAEAQLH